jgi:DNA topoisomerase IB
MLAEPKALVMADPAGPGISRRRCGRGFRYTRPDGAPLSQADRSRIQALVIPPAWQDVWICPDRDGHIQAMGTDAAGRRQYLYHRDWREQRDQEKFEHAQAFGAALPDVRAAVERDLAGRGLLRPRVLAAAVRLVDLGFFRPGDADYAEENGSFGLTTIRREHVRCRQGQLRFDFPGKSGKRQERVIADDAVAAVISSLRRVRPAGEPLFAYRAGSGWREVTGAGLNEYLREIAGGDFSVKDFRTWHATVLAAVALAVSANARDSEAGRQRAIVRAVREVSGYLGNTPAVARSAYIDPRVIERYEDGKTIANVLGELGRDLDFGELATRGGAERAVLRLLRERG